MGIIGIDMVVEVSQIEVITESLYRKKKKVKKKE